MSKLDMLFHPDGVAIIGASTNPSKIGYQILSNLRKSGYQGGIYPVNPGASDILGLRVLCLHPGCARTG